MNEPMRLVGAAIGTLLWCLFWRRLLSRWPQTAVRWAFPLRLRGVDVVLTAACWILVMGGGADPAVLGADDFPSLPQFSQALEAQRLASASNFSQRVYTGLTPKAQQALRSAADGAALSDEETADLFGALNEALRSPALIEASDATEGKVPGPLVDAVVQQKDVLEPSQLARLNRLALERTFPGMIRCGVRALFLRASIRSTALLLLIPLLLTWLGGVPLQQLGIHGRNWRSYALFGAAGALLYGPPTILLNVLIRWYQPQQSLNPAQEYLLGARGAIDWLLLIYAAAVAAPLLEELLFRSILQAWAGRVLGRTFGPVAGGAMGAAFASVLFGLAHGASWPDPLPLTFLGVGLGMTYQRTRSLWAPAAMHATFNAAMLAFGAAFGD